MLKLKYFSITILILFTTLLLQRNNSYSGPIDGCIKTAGGAAKAINECIREIRIYSGLPQTVKEISAVYGSASRRSINSFRTVHKIYAGLSNKPRQLRNIEDFKNQYIYGYLSAPPSITPFKEPTLLTTREIGPCLQERYFPPKPKNQLSKYTSFWHNKFDVKILLVHNDSGDIVLPDSNKINLNDPELRLENDREIKIVISCNSTSFIPKDFIGINTSPTPEKAARMAKCIEVFITKNNQLFEFDTSLSTINFISITTKREKILYLIKDYVENSYEFKLCYSKWVKASIVASGVILIQSDTTNDL